MIFVCRATAGLPVPVSSEKKSCQMYSIMWNILFDVFGPNELTVTFILSAGHIMQWRDSWKGPHAQVCSCY